MTQQHVCGGPYHGALLIRARHQRQCDGCTRRVNPGEYYISRIENCGGFRGYVRYKFCGHCERSTPQGREAVALLTKLKGTT